MDLDQTLVEYLQDPSSIPHPLVEKYLHGNCHIFAIALSRLTKLDIIALVSPRSVEGITALGVLHAFCHIPLTNCIFDAKGIRDCDHLKHEYLVNNETTMSYMTEQELLLKCEPVNQTPELMQAIEEDVSITIEFIKQYYKI